MFSYKFFSDNKKLIFIISLNFLLYFSALIVAVLFLGGIQLIGVGVLGDYIGRIYVDTKARPHYLIRSIHYRK